MNERMTFSRRFRGVSLAVVVLGMLCLGFAEMNPFYLGLIMAVSVAVWLRERFGIGRPVPRPFLNVMILGAVAFAAVDYIAISQGWIVSLAHFLLIVQMANLLLARSERNYTQMYLISLMNVAVAAIVTVGLLFALAYIAYTVLAVYGLVLFHFHCEASRASSVYLPEDSDTVRPTRDPDLGRIISPRFTWTLLTVILFTWMFNAVFFVLSPRVEGGFLRLNPLGVLGRLTGFSESVRLGQLGRIMQDESPVMHVTLRDSRGEEITGENDFYWRGMTYQHYTGSEWGQLAPGFDQLRFSRREEPPCRFVEGPLPLDGWIEQTVTMEPINTRSFFMLPGILAFDCPGLPLVAHNWMDQTVQSLGVMNQVTKYRVISAWPPSDLLNRPMRKQSINREEERRFLEECLQLPPAVTRRVRDLPDLIAPLANYPDPRQRARRIEAWLKERCAYTLDLKPNASVEPVEDFLFNRREGHCEYFASSMVVLLRAADIPARLVSGFHGAEWSDVGRYYIVKQSDAHAWVEAYFEPEGWVRFDPTPAAERDLAARAARFGWFGRYFDFLRTQWINYVVDYDHKQQTALLGRTRSMISGFRGAVGRMLSSAGSFFKEIAGVLTDFRRLTSPEGGLTVLGVLVASTVLVLTARWMLIRFARRIREHFAVQRAGRAGKVHVGFYSEFERVLKRRGFERPAAATPQEFADALASHFHGFADQLRRLAEAFYRVRFGAARLRADEERELRELVDLVRHAPATK